MSKYFTIYELTRSDTALRHGIKNIPSQIATLRLKQLIEIVLDPLRELWGAPITITSGYRSPKLNSLVGGVKNSQHITGNAADLTAGSVNENKRLFELIRHSDIPFDQLILEKGGKWIHISYRRHQPRKQTLKL